MVQSLYGYCGISCTLSGAKPKSHACSGNLKAEELITFLGEHAGDSGSSGKEGGGSAKGGEGGNQEADDDKDKVVPQVLPSWAVACPLTRVCHSRTRKVPTLASCGCCAGGAGSCNGGRAKAGE